MELLEQTKTYLENKGFASKGINGGSSYCLSKDNKYSITEKPFTTIPGTYKSTNGYELNIKEVYRNNGTQANVSVRAIIIKWNDNMGSTITERIKFRKLTKGVIQKLDNLVKEYEAL